MKTLFSTLILLCSLVAGCSQTLKPIPLSAPDMTREATMMQAFAQRKSTREFSPRMLSKQDLSDLLWAANGINRPESGKRTAPSAMNRQDIDLYVCLEKGAYFFDYKQNTLVPVTDQDLRTMKDAPVVLLLVARGSGDEPWGAMDAGIVSQNISLFCAAAGLATVPRASMDAPALARALGLPEDCTPMLNHPVGYFRK